MLAKPVEASLLVNTMMTLMGHAARDPGSARRVEDASLLEASMATLRGARLLLVEDNDINQLVAGELLRGVGLLVDVADNGQIGVNQVHARHAQGQPYDMVLMDMQMPVMDGVTATRLIRETYPAQSLPIVAMTANAMQVDRERCLAAGMTGFVSKPINPEDLWRALLDGVRPRAGLGLTPAAGLASADPSGSAPALLNTLHGVAGVAGVAGLDVAQGLRQCNHNSTLYTTMLCKFVQSQAQSVHLIRSALAQGDGVTAERLAHTLKGLAASLGAQPLQQCAAALEQALHSGTAQSRLETLIAPTQSQLESLLAALRATPGLLPAALPSVSAELSGPERAQVQRVIQTLLEMLEQDDYEALSLWEDHAPGLHAVLQQASALEQAINGFEFEEALRLLQAQV